MCVGGKQYSNTNNIIEYKKVNPKTKKLGKIIKEKCSVCGRNKSQIFTKYLTRAESFIKNAECKRGHQSAMSNSAWCDLKKDCTVLMLHELCHNPKCNCRKQTALTRKQFQLEGSGFKIWMKKKFKGTDEGWNNFIKAGSKIVSPVFSKGGAAKTKKPQLAQKTSIILKS